MNAPPLTREQLADTLVPIAAQLVGTIRDYGPEDVAAVLGRVPEGRHDALAVILAAMVNPDASPTELLAWTKTGPVRSREFTPAGRYLVHGVGRAEASGMSERRTEVARLSALGVPAAVIAERVGISERAVVRHRKAIRQAVENAP